MGARNKIGLTSLQSMFAEIFGLGRAAALSASLVIVLGLILAVYWFFHLAPPNTIIMSSGP